MLALSLTLSGCGGGSGNSKSTKKETSTNSTLVEVSKLDGNTISYGSQAYFYISLKQKPSSEVVIPIKTSNPDEAILAGGIIAAKFTPDNYQNRKIILQGVKKDRTSNTQNYTIVIGKAKSDDARYDGLDLDDIEVKTNYLEVSPIKDNYFTPNVENFIYVNVNYNGKYSLEYKLLKSPKGMKIDESGTISWTPTNEFVGKSANVNVEVKDKIFSDTLSFKVNVSKPKELQTKKLDNKEIEIISAKSNLKGLKIKLQNNSYTSDSLNLATVSENSVKEIPDFIQRFTDIFISKEPIKGKVSFKIPSSLLPKGVNLGDIDLYVLTFVNEFGKKIWSPVAMDKKYYKESGIDILDISLNGIVGEFFVGAEKSVINSIKPRSLKKKVYPRSANGIECKEQSDKSIVCKAGKNTITIEGFHDKEWKLDTPDELVKWITDAQKGFESLGMEYKNEFRVKIHQMPESDWLGYLDDGNNENHNVLHITKKKYKNIDLIRATVYHEYFHHAQAKTASKEAFASFDDLYTISGEGKVSYKKDRQFFIEGTAQWFEDYLDDKSDSYTYTESTLHNILNAGLAHTLSGGGEERPYQRFAFFKMLRRYCYFDEYINSLMFYPKNNSFVQHFKSKINSKCNFPSFDNNIQLTNFEKSLHFYQNAMMNKKDISILDKNEDNKKLKYDTSSIETYYGTIRDTSFNVESYGVKSFMLEPSKNNGFFEWLIPSAGGYDKLVLSFHSSHDASMSIANEEFQLYDVKKGDNTFDITDINYKSFITIANNLSEDIEISNLKIDKQEILEDKAEFEIMIEDNPKVLYDLSKYKVYLKFKNTNKPNNSKDIEWGSSSAGASDATIENGILNIPDIDDDKQNVSLKIRATFDGVTVYRDVIIENKPKTCRDDNQGCPKCQSDETLKYEQDGSGYCEVKIQKINTKPVAFSQNVSVYKNAVKWINLLGSDADNDPLNFKFLYKPSHGILDQMGSSVIYIPDVDYVGKDGFTYLVNDGKEDSNKAEILITIKENIKTNTKPVAMPQKISISKNASKYISFQGRDADGDPITYKITKEPLYGSLTKGENGAAYTPNKDYVGEDSFYYVSNDGKEDSNEVKVTITITQEPQTNTKPVALAQNLEVYEDNKLSISLKGKDGDGDRITDYEIIESPKLGKLIGASPNLSYQRENGYIGQDFFTFRVYDGKEWSDEAKVIIQIKQKIDEPATKPSTSSSEFLGLLATGQTSSYQDYDDGYYQKGLKRRYTRENGIVSDQVTKLQWQDDYSDNGGSITNKEWEDAKKYCGDLSLGGYTDWRLPSVDELLSIVDNGKYDPAISSVFENTTSYGDYWSSTSFASNPSYAWYVYFNDGYAFSYGKNYSRGVRCVRAGQ